MINQRVERFREADSVFNADCVVAFDPYRVILERSTANSIDQRLKCVQKSKYLCLVECAVNMNDSRALPLRNIRIDLGSARGGQVILLHRSRSRIIFQPSLP